MSSEEKRDRIQWHPAFYAAAQLEFREDAQHLEFYEEKTLSKAPLKIDVVIVKKNKDITTKNNIGRLFRGHNIIEYKAFNDALNVDTFHKVIAYACLFKANSKYVDEIRSDDITISLIRYRRPRKLMTWFESNGYEIEMVYPGIIYIRGGMFLCQIVVIHDLDRESHIWLKALTDRVDEGMITEITEAVANETEEYNRRLIKDVLFASMNANKERFNIVEGTKMDAVKELFGYDFAKVNKELKVAQKAQEKAQKAQEKAQKAQEKAQKARKKAEKENVVLRKENEMLKRQLAARS